MGVVFVFYGIYKIQKITVLKEEVPLLKDPIFTDGILYEIKNKINSNKLYSFIVNIVSLCLAFLLFHILVAPVNWDTSGSSELLVDFIVNMGIFWVFVYSLFYIFQTHDYIYKVLPSSRRDLPRCRLYFDTSEDFFEMTYLFSIISGKFFKRKKCIRDILFAGRSPNRILLRVVKDFPMRDAVSADDGLNIKR